MPRGKKKETKEETKQSVTGNIIDDTTEDVVTGEAPKKTVEESPKETTEGAPKETASESKKDEETVEVNKTDLDRLFKKVDDQSKSIETLMRVADKSQLARIRAEENNTGSLVQTARIWRFGPDGKIVIATKLVSNQAEIINGRYVEDQQLAVFYEDGSTEKMPLLQFHRNVNRKEQAEIVGREEVPNKETGDSEIVYKFQLEDGKNVKINSKFIN